MAESYDDGLLAGRIVTDLDGIALRKAREAFIAAHTDKRIRQSTDCGTNHADQIDITDFRDFAAGIWSELGGVAPLYISPIEGLPSWTRSGELSECAAAARWAIPKADRIGVPRTGVLYGTSGEVAYIDVAEEGLNRLVALHELAHLSVDTADVLQGHGPRWADAYRHLIERCFGVCLADLWDFEFHWWHQKAKEKIAQNPAWLGHLLT